MVLLGFVHDDLESRGSVLSVLPLELGVLLDPGEPASESGRRKQARRQISHITSRTLIKVTPGKQWTAGD